MLYIISGSAWVYSCISYTFYNVNKYNYYNDKKRFTTCRVYVGNKYNGHCSKQYIMVFYSFLCLPLTLSVSILIILKIQFITYNLTHFMDNDFIFFLLVYFPHQQECYLFDLCMSSSIRKQDFSDWFYAVN